MTLNRVLGRERRSENRLHLIKTRRNIECRTFRARYQIAGWTGETQQEPHKLLDPDGSIPVPLPVWAGDVRVPDRDKAAFGFCLDKVRRVSAAGRLAESIRTAASIFVQESW